MHICGLLRGKEKERQHFVLASKSEKVGLEGSFLGSRLFSHYLLDVDRSGT